MFTQLGLKFKQELESTTVGTTVVVNRQHHTSVGWDFRLESTNSTGSRDYGIMTLTRTNHENSAVGVGGSLLFKLKDSTGALNEYAGINGVKLGDTTGQLRFMAFGRTYMGSWDLGGGLIVGTDLTVNGSSTFNGEIAANLINSPYGALDRRDVKPNTSGLSGLRAIRPYFTDLAQSGLLLSHNSATMSGYADTLIFDTYNDSSGGLVNAISFSKDNSKVYHFQGSHNASSWSLADRFLMESEFGRIRVNRAESSRANLLAIVGAENALWSGIQFRGQHAKNYSLMGDATKFGLYLENESEWGWWYMPNGAFYATYNGGTKFNTTTAGVKVTGETETTGNSNTRGYVRFGDTLEGRLRFDTYNPSNAPQGGNKVLALENTDGSSWQALRILDSAEDDQALMTLEHSGNAGSSWDRKFEVRAGGDIYTKGKVVSLAEGKARIEYNEVESSIDFYID